jgi:hypothetical protein
MMPELKLAKLPDRTPVKISINVSPDLHSALTAYADAYHAAYGSAESVAELIPYMLAAFIENDSGFRKARRSQDTALPSRTGRRLTSSRGNVPVPSTASSSNGEPSN